MRLIALLLLASLAGLAQANEEARQRECTENRAQLTALENGQRMHRLNENGERVFLDDDERAAAIERTRRAVEKLCR